MAPIKLQLLAAAAALIFACHPLHVEVVVWVTQRNELLATTFILLSLVYYIRGRSTLSIAFFALAMLAKPTSIGLPVLLISFDLIFKPDFKYQHILNKIPYILIAAIAGLVSLYAHDNIYAVKLHDLYSPVQRLCFAAYNMMDFTYRFFVPLHLTPMLEFPYWIQSLSLRAFLPLLFILLILLLALRIFWRTARAEPLLIIAYLALLLPGSGLVMIGTYAASDRYMYLPSALLVVLIAAGFYQWLANKNFSRSSITLPAILILVFFIPLTMAQASHWKDDISLWTYTTQQQPKAATAQIYLDLQRMLHKEITVAEAAQHIEIALKIEPVYVGFENLLKLYTALGDKEKLLYTHQRIIQYYPNYSGASHVTLAIQQLNQGSVEAARKNISAGIRIDPTLCAQILEQYPTSAELKTIVEQARVENLCD